MSEKFKVGDRVKVEFEGKVKWVDASGDGVDVDAGCCYTYLASEHVTLIERPVEPLAVGSVVVTRSAAVYVVTERGVALTTLDGAVSLPSAPTAEDLARYVHYYPAIYTLIYDSKESK